MNSAVVNTIHGDAIASVTAATLRQGVSRRFDISHSGIAVEHQRMTFQTFASRTA